MAGSSPSSQQSVSSKAGKKKKQAKVKKTKDPKAKSPAGAKSDSKKRSKKKDFQNFSGYIFKVLRAGDPEGGISSRAMSIMNSFVNDMFQKLASEASRLQKIRGSKTMDSRDIQSATKLLMPGALGKHAVAEGVKAITAFSGSK